MAIDDSRSGGKPLGKSLREILESTPEIGERTESILYGGEVTATPEAVKESLTYVTAGHSLPPVETIYPIKQSTGSKRGVKRPDKNKEFYSRAVVRQSTRVWGLQWVPTRLSDSEEDTGNVYGDIVAAFARPSNTQLTSVYIYPDQEQKTWETLKYGSSFGKGINTLNGGRPYTATDGSRHSDLHPYEPGLFSKMLSELNSGRPGNESKTYAEVLARADITASGRKSAKEARRLRKASRAKARAERVATERVISGGEDIMADLRSKLFGDKGQ